MSDFDAAAYDVDHCGEANLGISCEWHTRVLERVGVASIQRWIALFLGQISLTTAAFKTGQRPACLGSL